MKIRMMCLMGALGFLAGLFQPAWALLQTDFNFLGVSPDLTKLGVVETWAEDGRGFSRCEVRLYNRNTWKPLLVKEVPPADESRHFQEQCKGLQQSIIQQYDLKPVTWELAEMTPKAPAIKGEDGKLVSENELQFQTDYPEWQMFDFALPDGGLWQLVIQSATHPNALEAIASGNEFSKRNQPGYTLVFRPQLEPVPLDTVQSPYEDGQFLLSPIKMMVNNDYGIVALVFREYHYGFEGYDYHYRPYFMKWPSYELMSTEEAKNILVKTSQYTMAPSELIPSPDSMNPNYRAFLRLRAEMLTLDEIQAAMQQSSPAGQLYWMALLYDQDPEEYRTAALECLGQKSLNVDVIQITGEHWEPQSFKTLLRQQAQRFKVEL